MKRFSGIVVCIFVLGLFTSHLLAQDVLKLGIPLPLTGTNAKFGEIEKKSYEIAMEEINAKGGIKGKRVVLEFEDSQGKPEISRSIVERLIDVKKQPVIFGEYSSSSSKAVAAVAEERKVPYLVVTGATDDITQQKYKYVFRMNPTNAYYATGFMSFLKEVVKPKTIAILYESSDFGTSGAEDMVKQAQKAGMKVLVKEQYEKGAVDFKPILSKVKAARPDVIYMVSYVMDAALLMRQIKELRIDANLYAGGAAGFAIPEFIQNAKEASDLVVTATLWSPQVAYPGAREYAEKYKKLFKNYPSYHGAEAYSALYLIKDVLERAKSWKSDDIRTAFKATNMMTAFGPVKFEDKEGYTNQNFMDTLVMQVISGKHETIWPAKYASTKYVYPIPKWRDRK
ncbi:MAG TPA: ABC transporter substrate-binding protein [Syntrophorhabdaceae bacterium]|jgi:branched-chain amino acid transport system substrate-binding protein|nr:ABC transporter substrate-binding protein [Syntrophorhabdaceae bacterium]HOS05557.1 ABC transporter substrate-binding protein [Syntrophorhabdaceae bacterium]HPH40951.1 ABC transporter substrate-binding protein [Syntrophorhabdaceae bacterium]HPL40698.1 ABC transporter substrate-binding protein [Syntrophorhabdaceae bacterium]